MHDVRVRNKTTGNYTRQATLDDIMFLLECTQDWPNGAWSYAMAEGRIKTSLSNNYNVKFDSSFTPWNKLCIIFCDSTDTKLGFAITSFRSSSPDVETHSTSVDVAAMHPDYRGQGLYSQFMDHLIWGFLTMTDAVESNSSLLQTPVSFPAESRALRRGAISGGVAPGGLGHIPRKDTKTLRTTIESNINLDDYERIEV